MDQFERIARSSSSIEAAFAALRSSGASPVQAIIAVKNGRQVELADAKDALSQSPYWKAEVEAADRLHQDLIDALKLEVE